jgi:uncharacterized membrane protein YeaQ/YmgE (transglycosylase-associated protein family)
MGPAFPEPCGFLSSYLEDRKMYMSGESLLIILMVGLIAGWLAGRIMQGAGFGIVGDLLIGIVGAFIGSWLLPQLVIHLGLGIVAAIINATIGAMVLLLIIRLVRGGVRRQSFWDRERLKLRESLARLVCDIMRLADGAASGGLQLSVV